MIKLKFKGKEQNYSIGDIVVNKDNSLCYLIVGIGIERFSGVALLETKSSYIGEIVKDLPVWKFKQFEGEIIIESLVSDCEIEDKTITENDD